MTIKEIRSISGLSQAKFAEMYKIPRRTLEDWESGKNAPREYYLTLLEEKVRNNALIKKTDCYNPQTLFEMGYIYQSLLFVLNDRGKDPYGSSDIFPYKYIVMVLSRATSLHIPDELNRRIASLMDVFTLEDSDLMMNSPVPMELRQHWHMGMLKRASENRQ